MALVQLGTVGLFNFGAMQYPSQSESIGLLILLTAAENNNN